ncbi:MAG: UPF0147 family protein [Nanoarchaeota archaeon]|nr:UPF0147 family protein [Nanoarchaeota archaeon]
MPEAIQDVVELLAQIETDFSVPKNIRIRVRNAIDVLEDDSGSLLAVKADKALEELEAVSNDSNLPTYTRTQIWHIVSLLESNK